MTDLLKRMKYYGASQAKYKKTYQYSEVSIFLLAFSLIWGHRYWTIIFIVQLFFYCVCIISNILEIKNAKKCLLPDKIREAYLEIRTLIFLFGVLFFEFWLFAVKNVRM